MAPSLLGPPEIHHSLLATPDQKEQVAPQISNPFMDIMVDNFNKTQISLNPELGLTENGSLTFMASGDPCLDFFFHVVPDTPAETVTERLKLAWDHDSLKALKLIFNLRGVRGTGKSDKEGFYAAAFWLHKHHPKTLACNVEAFADFGYFKDLPEILYRLLEGNDVRREQKAEWTQRKREGMKVGPMVKRGQFKKSKKPREKRSEVNKEENILKALERSKIQKKEASESKLEKKISMAKKAVERYSRDPDYRFLFEQITDHFAKCLKSDMQHLNSGETTKVSLAAKWCPSIDSSFDRATLICESIARKVFPRELYPEYDESVEDAHYAYRVRDRLRKEVLVPLRKCLELPEVFIGANKWDSLPYNRVASVAMKFYKEKFLKHDEERFKQYLEDVKSGKAKIAAGALLPHEIIAALKDGDDGEVAELQWKRMVDDMLKNGKLRDCIAVCDVSGSMEGIPMEVSVALGVLVSELSADPWKGKLITFHEDPQLHLVLGDDLKSKTESVREMGWGYNTDFQKVFDLILEISVNYNLKPEDMIKRVFVFSDMEFDHASRNDWETDYQVIVRKFNEKGYGSVVPQIVFWNLRDSRATPVTGSQKGVGLVSGFSKNLMKLFFDKEGDINPVELMDIALAGEEYKKLVVID